MTKERINPFTDPNFLRRLKDLSELQDRGFISDLKTFEKVTLTRALVPWSAPFSYVRDGEKTFEAFKVYKDPTFKVIVRLWKIYGPGALIVSGFKPNGSFRMTRTIRPERLTTIDDRPKYIEICKEQEDNND